MKFSQTILLSFMLLSICVNVNAAEQTRTNVTITTLLPSAAQRPAVPWAQDYLSVIVNPAAWGSSDCQTDIAVIKASDEHLISVLLTAWTTGKNINIAVDDTLKPKPNSNICQVVFIMAQ